MANTLINQLCTNWLINAILLRCHQRCVPGHVSFPLLSPLKIQWHSAEVVLLPWCGSCQGLQHEFGVAQPGASEGFSRRAACVIHGTHLLWASVSRGLLRRLRAFRGKAIFFWLRPQTLKAPGGSMGCFGCFDSPPLSSSLQVSCSPSSCLDYGLFMGCLQTQQAPSLSTWLIETYRFRFSSEIISGVFGKAVWKLLVFFFHPVRYKQHSSETELTGGTTQTLHRPNALRRWRRLMMVHCGSSTLGKWNYFFYGVKFEKEG